MCKHGWMNKIWTKYDCFSITPEGAEVKRLLGDLPLADQGNW